MARIVLIHWKPAEAAPCVAVLRYAGFDVECLAPDGAVGLRPLLSQPPDAFVIDLDRLPSHGREVGVGLRRQRGTRGTPLVFAGGAPEKVARVRELLPDAVYTSWECAGGAVRPKPGRFSNDSRRVRPGPPTKPISPEFVPGCAEGTTLSAPSAPSNPTV